MPERDDALLRDVVLDDVGDVAVVGRARRRARDDGASRLAPMSSVTSQNEPGRSQYVWFSVASTSAVTPTMCVVEIGGARDEA